MRTGQGDVLQIWDETSTKILYAYDKENKVWVKSADILQSDFMDVEHYIQVNTWAEFANLIRLEKMVLMPIAEDTYFPPLDKIVKDYMTDDRSQYNAYGPDFNAGHPFGRIEDGSKTPFRYVNVVLLSKGEGRNSDTYIVTEQVYNPDGTFSLLHFGYTSLDPDMGFDPDLVIGTLQAELFRYPQGFLLPAYKIDPYVLQGEKYCSIDCTQLKYLKDNGYEIVAGGKYSYLPGIKALTDKWLSTGSVPEELENMILIRQPSTIMRVK
jgi:hypothetical protein